jgi:hypothetical protein
MTKQAKTRPDLTLMPMLAHEALYIGVDIGKLRHVAGFLSRTLLQRHEHFEGCPTYTFEQSREGFRAFVDRIREYVPLEQVTVLLEHTGHYHRLLEQYLLDLDITVYRIHVQKRAEGMLKTDKRDALSLANTLYTQLELGAQVRDKMQLVRRIVPPTSAAAQLQGVMRHRYDTPPHEYPISKQVNSDLRSTLPRAGPSLPRSESANSPSLSCCIPDSPCHCLSFSQRLTCATAGTFSF